MNCLQLVVAALLVGPVESAEPHHVIVVVTDGLRPSEVFSGADPGLFGALGGVENPAGLAERYWRPSPVERRATLLPFIWGTVATEGQVFGDDSVGSPARVTNRQRVSYPGYNELFTGFADARITSNAMGDNPNVTVLEWLDADPELRGRVQVFATWETFFRIFNTRRSGLDVRAGWNPPFERDQVRTPAKDVLDQLFRTTTPMFGGNALDSVTYAAVKESLKTNHPRVLFVGFGETDEWMHAGRYDLALEAAHRVDGYLADLWATVQSLPEYHGRTTLLVTTDHGRGHGEAEWREHGADIDGSDEVWMAVLGPGAPALGVRRQAAVTQGQVAATIAQLMGRDWVKVSPMAAAPLPLERNAWP